VKALWNKLREQLAKFRSREPVWTVVGLTLLSFACCVGLFELILAPGAGFRFLTPAPKAVVANDDPQSPMAVVRDALKSDAEKQADAARRKSELEEKLKNSLQQKLADTESAITDVEKSRVRFDSDFQSKLNTTLDASPLPHELATLLANERTVAQGWTDIKNLHTTPGTVAALNDSLRPVKERIDSGTFLEDDLRRLDDISKKANATLQTEQKLRVALDHIEVMLNAVKFQEHKDQSP